MLRSFDSGDPAVREQERGFTLTCSTAFGAVIDGWAQLDRHQFVLVDGASLGFGRLIERYGDRLRITIPDPATEKPLVSLEAFPSTLVKDFKAAVAAAAPGELDPSKMALGRGKGGEATRRVDDASLTRVEVISSSLE